VVLEPPVSLRAPGPKAPVIASVGRFFAPGRGHAKKQLELVRAFREVDGRVPGWELHLLGGCSPEDRGYLDEVRAAVEGLPVFLHVDASGPELADLYARASLYWQATGLGEDLEADPVRAEHFGIAVVEAMSAGAVPIVLDEGGPVEIVRPGLDGAWFRDERALVETTVALIGDADRRQRMSRSAIERAAAYGRDRFAGRLCELVADVTGWDSDPS
jgi:glycosyltransferase involved in cell wall biosynthesis